VLDRPAQLERQARRRLQKRQRDRRHRHRRKCGQRIAPTPYDGEVLNFLIRTHWLDEAMAGDDREVGLAISRMIADAAR
jgi:hypothetical protein